MNPPPETHTTPKQIRIPDDDWNDLGTVAGKRQRARVVVQLIRWYLRRPGAKLPIRPPRGHEARSTDDPT